MKWQSRTIPDLIIEVWEALDCESVGARELGRIQEALVEKFGEGAEASPASIARTVADEGAVLRHPEVFDFDAQWRERKMVTTSAQVNFASLSDAFISFVKLDEQRQRLEGANDEQGLKRLRQFVVDARADAQLRAQSKIINLSHREEAKEIANSLRVWLESPELFLDWLELRRRSPEFIKKFGD
jgi:hypothetical protein